MKIYICVVKMCRYSIIDVNRLGLTDVQLNILNRRVDYIKSVISSNDTDCLNRIFNEQSYNGYTAFHWAVRDYDTTILKLIVNCCKQFNQPDNDNITPIHLSCRCASFEAFKILYEAGANVSIRDKYNSSVFDTAKKLESSEIIKILESSNLLC